MEYNKKFLNNSKIFRTRNLYDNLLNHIGIYFNITFYRKHIDSKSFQSKN